MKNIFKTISILTLFILMFTLVGCKEPHEHKFVNKKCECGEVHDCTYNDGVCECGYFDEKLRIEYFNQNLKITNYKSIDYYKKIEYSGMILLEENTKSDFNGSVYTIVTTKKFINLDEYIESTETKEDTEPTEISLQLKSEYFTKITLSDNGLEGIIKDTDSSTVLGITASSIEIKVTFNEELKVSNITLKYIDETNFNVSITVSFNY